MERSEDASENDGDIPTDETELESSNKSSEDDGSEEKAISCEERLKDALSVCIADSAVVETLYNYEPSDQTELHPVPLFKVLVEEMSYVWFDLFRALGIEHKALEGIRQRYPFDPDASLFEAIGEWLGDDKINPSWKALVETLHSEMLEAKLADVVAEKHFSAEELESYKKNKAKTQVNEPIPPGFEEDEAEFSKLLLEITDQLGPDCFPEFNFFLKSLHCPDGSRFIDKSYLKDQRSPEGLLIPLLYNNILVSQDLDMLISLLRGLGRDDLMPLLHGYSAKLTISYPVFKAIQDTEHFFSLLVCLQPKVTELDLEGVSYIKQEVCELLSVEKAPYLLQFLGWKKDASIVVQFQVHMCLADRVREVVRTKSQCLENFSWFETQVRGCVFHYDLNTEHQHAKKISKS